MKKVCTRKKHLISLNLYEKKVVIINIQKKKLFIDILSN